MKAEARVLRAYYYFLLFQQYGPIYIWGDKEADLGIMGDNVDRNTVDECVDFMTSQLEMAANDLPVKVADPTTWQGRITKGFALGLRSRIFLYAARPLFNGGGEIQYGRSLVNKYGEHISHRAKTLTSGIWPQKLQNRLLTWVSMIFTRLQRSLLTP